MCRWAAYVGQPVFLADIIADPVHSLIDQSRNAEECKTNLNADDFGVAWYGHRRKPGLYRDIYPAWSDPNLRALSEQVKSALFLAHVRASTGSAISRNNCHPFVVDRWSFMHNGQIGGFEAVRKAADMLIPNELYRHRRGATDSEAFFLVALGNGLETDPLDAIARAIATFEALATKTPKFRMTAAFSDGEKLYAVRYASDDRAPTLYHRWSGSQKGRAVVSEPFDADSGVWQEIPDRSFCIFEGQQVKINKL
jgi:predicted glutamine amidotransferase